MPRYRTIPERASSSGAEVVELAALAGLDLDDWQALVIDGALGERADGMWAAKEVGLVVSRQNGKGGILEARELAGLFLFGERLIIHSAHLFDTAMEAFRRLLTLIESVPEFDSRVKRVVRSHGEEGIELRGGQRIRFRTRTKGGGRGLSGDCVIFDEAMELPEAVQGAVMPVVSARPNPQLWYVGSAVDQFIHEHGRVFARVRARGIAGDKGLAFFEWSAPCDSPAEVTEEMAADPVIQRAANPAERVPLEHIDLERRSMHSRTFAVERLGVGDWPSLDEEGEQIFDPERWAACRDQLSKIVSRPMLAVDMTPDRAFTAIGAAGAGPQGVHGEVIEHERGTAWVLPRLIDLYGRHDAEAVVIDGYGQASTLIPELEAAGVTVVTTSARDVAQACALLFDAVEQETFRHLGQGPLNAAAKGAAKRKVGDAWAFSRGSSGVDISPLMVVTLAHWAFRARPVPEPKARPRVIDLSTV